MSNQTALRFARVGMIVLAAGVSVALLAAEASSASEAPPGVAAEFARADLDRPVVPMAGDEDAAFEETARKAPVIRPRPNLAQLRASLIAQQSAKRITVHRR